MEQSRLINLGIGSISLASCWRLARPQTCVYGRASFAGCKGGCGYAVFPGSGELILMGHYTVTGTLVHVETGRPIAEMPVSLIMPTGTRYRTRSNAKGKFVIAAKADSSVARRDVFKVKYDLARMVTVPEAKEIVLVGDLTREFRRMHPELEYRDVKVADFKGKTVEQGSSARE